MPKLGLLHGLAALVHWEKVREPFGMCTQAVPASQWTWSIASHCKEWSALFPGLPLLLCSMEGETEWCAQLLGRPET